MHFRSLLILALCCLVRGIPAPAQTYIPFPDSNALWTIHYSPRDDSEFRMQYIALKFGDTLISGMRYHKLYRSADSTITPKDYLGGVREDSSKRVWFLFGYHGTATQNEMVLYDFSRNAGDTLQPSDFNGRNNWGIPLLVSSVDTQLIDGAPHRRLTLTPIGPTADWYTSTWIEGVGNGGRGPVFSSGTFPFNGIRSDLMCMNQDHRWIYHNPIFPECMYIKGLDVKSSGMCPAIQVFPNPVQDLVYINNAAGNHHIIRNYQGQIILDGVASSNRFSLSLKDLASGNYLLQVVNTKGQVLLSQLIIRN